MLRALYRANKALECLTLTDQPLTFNREHVAQLEYTYRMLDQQLMRASEEKGRDHQTLELGHSLTRFSLRELLEEEEMIRLKNGEAVDFIIPENRFADYYHVFVTRVRAHFAGLDTEASPALRLTHSGHAKFYDKNGIAHEFTHAARTTITYHGDADGASLGQSEDFIALSPFGPWRVDLALASSNKNISFAGLEDITLEFKTAYMPLQ